MNILIIILLAIAGIIALLLIIGLFSKKGYVIERNIAIKRSTNDVFDYIKYIRNQDFYSKWVMTDPTMKKTYTGSDGHVGFVYAWDSTNKNAGKGEQEIKSVAERQKLETEIRFEKPFKGISQAQMITADLGGNQTKVTWTFTSAMRYPMNIMMLFINFDKLLGKDMETSLTNLKGILEK